MIDFFRALFRPAAPSGATAKERLRLVLLSDHLSLAPDVVEALKRDLLEVISRYVEIDSDHADVSFEHREREVAMLASIPIKGVRERRAAPEAPAAAPSLPASSLQTAAPEAAAEPAVPSEPDSGSAAAADVPKLASATSANAARPRRRRRKKPPGAQPQRAVPPSTLGNPAAQA